MNILITGGTGFVGLNIAEKLLKSGNNVILYAQSSFIENAKRDFKNYKGTCYYVNGNVLDSDLIQLTIKKYTVSTIIHAAVITPSLDREKRDTKTIMNVNCIGTIEALEAAEKNNVSKFIYLSSVAVYGEAAFENKILREDTSIPKPRDLYEISKFSAESIVNRYKELHAMDVIIARIGDVFGPWEYRTGVRDTLSAPFQALSLALQGKNVKLPRIDYKSWVYSRDIAVCVEKLLKTPFLKHHMYHLNSRHFWSMKDWCDLLSERYPKFKYEIVGTDDGNIVFQSEKEKASLDISRLIADTNYVPEFDLKRSFEDYVLWAEENHNLLIDH